MLSRLDDIIYPNRCEVIEIKSSQRYIYPIYKNASTSIRDYALDQKYKFFFNEQIRRIKKIDVIIRDPLTRFLSGFNTFIWTVKRDHPTLDLDTIIYFAESYLFLNRHYAPQITWLINLHKYLDENTKLCFYGMNSIANYTQLTLIPDEKKILSAEVIERLKFNIHNQIYLKLDNLLVELIGKELTFKEVLSYIKQQDPQVYSKLSCIALD